MSDVYRIWCKVGKAEIEVESSDRRYVEEKLVGLLRQLGIKGGKTVVKSIGPKKATKKKATKKKTAKKKATKKKTAKKKATKKKARATTRAKGSVRPEGLARAIRKQAIFGQVQEHILRGSGQLPRVMVCHYFADKLGDGKQGLTATQVEMITDQLGARIASPNVAKVIRQKAKKYFSSDRKQGVTRHKINRAGIAVAELMLQGDA